MESIWSRTTEHKKRVPLTKDIQVEAAVIGGGMAGILTAWFLQNAGLETVVLEAAQAGGGQTKNTSAKITSQHGLVYANLLKTFGAEKALQYARANEHAIEHYRRIIKEQDIVCQLETRSAYLYAVEDAEVLRQEAEAAKTLGLYSYFTKDVELPFEVKGALCFDRQAQFHPLRFLYALAEKLTVYEQTAVTEIRENCLYTTGGSVKAKYVVFASHFPFLNVPGYYFMRMHQQRSYIMALKNATQLNGMYLGIDGNQLSFRNSGDLLLLGGAGHRTGENEAGGRYEKLRKCSQSLWPDSQEMAHWSAQDCMTLDGIPYIGQFSSATPNWYVATGFQKWGMTSSMLSAELIREAILGRSNPDAEVFSPQRVDISASAKQFMEEGKQVAKSLSQKFFSLPKEQIEEVENGHGKIVEYEGEKVGVYKNEDGEAFIVSVKCPHLGCQLKWNQDEISWDCPCHGSRFDYEGNLLDNPAQGGLTYE